MQVRLTTLMLMLTIVAIGLGLATSRGWQAQQALAQEERAPQTASALSGSAMPRDIDTGTPSLNSDRLIIQLSNVETPPAEFALNGYLLEDVDGSSVGALPISGGGVNTIREFPGNNLIQNYNTFRLMWEKPVFEDAMPAEAMGLIRQAVHQAAGTPGGTAYGVGMVQEARMMLTHANLARLSANANNLAGARLHTEHVLNILFGAEDPRHMDYNGDGKVENPGDGFGLLPYTANLEYVMLTAVESSGVTDYIADQAFAVSQMVANFSLANGTGTWADDLIAQATQALNAASGQDAQAPANQVHALATRILNGSGEDAGALTVFETVQRTANYFPSGDITGEIRHGSAAANAPTRSDQLTVALSNVPQPPGNVSLWAYLLAQDGRLLALGELPWDNGDVVGSFAFANRNLIGEFSAFRLVQGSVYAQENHPSAVMSALRNVMARAGDTPGAVGYGVGLVQQAQILREMAAQASAAASASNLPLAQERARQALNVLVGETDPRYDPNQSHSGDGFGVLVYAGRVDQSMQQVSESPGATASMIQRSGDARTHLANFWPATGSGTWGDELVTQLQQVIAAGDLSAAQGPANQAAALADRILNGAGAQGGARATYLSSQQVGDYFPVESGATLPDEAPVPGPNPDAFENDDLCSRAANIATDGTPQARTFHYEGDADWVRFTAQANKSYVIEANGIGAKADPIIALYDTCESSPDVAESDAFGNSVRLTWNSTKNGTYYIRLQQFDPAAFGEGTEYELKVTLDNIPPSVPTNPRCLSIDQTTIAMQWTRSPQFDVVGYQVAFRNESATDTGIRDVTGAGTTFIELGDLTPGELYFLSVQALDFSRNISDPTTEIACRPQQPADSTPPVFESVQPTAAEVFTTTAATLTFSGEVRDTGGNLSRVRVRNASINQERTDFSLSGAAAPFRVEDLPLRVGTNEIRLTAFDEANNPAERIIDVRRLADSRGAVLIVAGHNETFGLQTNIYNAANRAYRIFLSAGYTEDDIYYLAPVAQDATGDGSPNTRNVPLSPAAVEDAIRQWAMSRVGEGRPFHIYLMDHGFQDRYCVTGCSDGNIITPKQLNDWLSELEHHTGLDELNIFIEACQSGSFLDNLEGEATNVENSLAGAGRVVVTSTGRVNNAYASADGAFFSDAFFSCLADSNSIKACFDEGVTAVALAGVDQTPWLDDNGDGVFNQGDGSLASQRTITRFFSAVRPQILSVDVERTGDDGVLIAQVTAGAEAVRLVWAAVYPPDFEEPTDVTLNLNVPVVRLNPVQGSETPNLYRFEYINGFSGGDLSDYRIIFYAQDRLGIHAAPVRFGDGEMELYLPSVQR